ncbi:MAG: tRNA (adenosine(37)-N6)-threonylcarbamoyltransferase complex ATPase subunit type 1 TsaE [Cyanobacteria bacterium]|nr:tRNA (adenosine(37)-N6)-threonylcarbamoyltransferase complex ATPase subunit type 1 TsaE [Cyanobacteriota bacterium]MDA0867035.1 tRNA (adenosine(37)-N6)-threonylcarbamoyltransferase complex ATPase subunit type 1 TsaE [Cyanobacteriota bacterium]
MAHTIRLRLPNPNTTQRLGQWLGQHLAAGTTLLLEGDLGSGKTTFVKGLGTGLQVPETIDSPTFTLISEYHSGRLPLYHVDLYRLEGAAVDGLFLEAYWDGIEFAPGIVAIEWAERLHYLPPEPLTITFSHAGDRRLVVLTPSNSTQITLLEALPTDAILANEV